MCLSNSGNKWFSNPSISSVHGGALYWELCLQGWDRHGWGSWTNKCVVYKSKKTNLKVEELNELGSYSLLDLFTEFYQHSFQRYLLESKSPVIKRFTACFHSFEPLMSVHSILSSWQGVNGKPKKVARGNNCPCI